MLNTALVVTQLAIGLTANSLALVSDAAHNAGDVLGLGLAWGASWLGARHPSARRTYGLRRSSILAALVHALLILLATGGLAWEAVRRLSHAAPVASVPMIIAAIVGVAVNGFSAMLFVRGQRDDLNLRGAFLHLSADAWVSVGVALAGAAILFTRWNWLDPVISLVIGAVIIHGTWSLLRDSTNLALDAVPAGIDPVAVAGFLRELPGVYQVHDLHIWALSTSETALTAHLVAADGSFGDDRLIETCNQLHHRFGIGHSTLQIERDSLGCPATRGAV